MILQEDCAATIELSFWADVSPRDLVARTKWYGSCTGSYSYRDIQR